jgi:D-glycero-alpha-D-manno-heptose-7-phosphate kinase
MTGVLATAPVRLDLSGGTLDVWPLPYCLGVPAVTVNVALGLHARARVFPTPDGGRELRLRSEDQGEGSEHPDLAHLAAAASARAHPLALLARAVLAVPPPAGLTLVTQAAFPQGSGLGGSSALLCATLAALLAHRGDARDGEALCRLAQAVETQVLRAPTGYQDYYPAVLGGCLALEATLEGVHVARLPVDLERLALRLRLVYTGAPHVSGLTNWGVLKAFVDGEARTRTALEAIAQNSLAVRAALEGGDLEAALAGVIEDGRLRREMAPGVSTPLLEEVERRARAAGALARRSWVREAVAPP